MAKDRPRERTARRAPKPLDPARLEELALSYVARFSTTAGKLTAYLARKIRERGFEGEAQAHVGAIVERFVERGYVDDAVYGRAKARDLLARGYGGRRIDQALRGAGLEEALREDLRPEEHQARTAIVALARKRRFGPFAQQRAAASGEDAQKIREKRLAAMLRAGHAFDHARKVMDAHSVEELEEWVAEASHCD